MKLKLHRASITEAAPRPTLLDFGHRVQPNSQLAGVRHFRPASAHVKHSPAASVNPLATGGRLTGTVSRNYLRALRAAEMKAWVASGGDVLRTGAAI